MSDWKHSESWKRRGKDFLVEVNRHEVGPSDDPCEGPNRWAVYAYIYPEHPHFAKFNGPNIWEDAAQVMPLHRGASLLEYPMYGGNVTSVKVGADYHHLGDNHTNDASREDDLSIFNDADRLFDWLQTKSGEAS